MTREHFKKTGQLFRCPNPAHDFRCGRVVGSWQWAKTTWGAINGAGNLVTTWVGLWKSETPDGLAVVTVVLWKFCITVGLSPLSNDVLVAKRPGKDSNA